MKGAQSEHCFHPGPYVVLMGDSQQFARPSSLAVGDGFLAARPVAAEVDTHAHDIVIEELCGRLPHPPVRATTAENAAAADKVLL